jgi:uncharacterized protein YndB with AHSA1/START domain
VTDRIEIAPVKKTILVQATPQHAFDVFTAGIDRWWPKSHGIGSAPIRESIIEPFVGGRWYAKCEDGTDAVVGHVLIWEPAQRFVVTWAISADWKPEIRTAYASEVEVRFLSESAGCTRIELQHRHFERMGSSAGETMRKNVDGGWIALLERFALAASSGRGRAP